MKVVCLCHGLGFGTLNLTNTKCCTFKDYVAKVLALSVVIDAFTHFHSSVNMVYKLLVGLCGVQCLTQEYNSFSVVYKSHCVFAQYATMNFAQMLRCKMVWQLLQNIGQMTL